jgi:glycosyltransferase involved in cell wall biosynthesis
MTTAGIAISNSIARFVIEVEGAPPPKVQVIRYGLEYKPLTPAERQTTRRSIRQQFNIGPDVPVVGMICRLVEQKGVTFGLQAFAEVTKSLPDAHLIIAGDGPLQSALEAEATGLNVRFLGWYDNVSQLLCGLDVLLVPSLWEGFGLVILEAMSRQVPVIASAVSAIPEIVVPGETGLLVPPGDVPRLSAALLSLLSDAPLRQHMGMLAEDRLETHFSARRMVNETVGLYQKLV